MDIGIQQAGCIPLPGQREGQAGSYGRLAYSPFTRSNDKQIFYIGQLRFLERPFGSITLFVHLLFFFILFSLPCINRFCKPDNRSTKRMPSRWSYSCRSEERRVGKECRSRWAV